MENTVPPLHAKRALEQVEGDWVLLRELFMLFKQEVPHYLAEVHAALDAGDAEHLRRVAHTIKGAVGNFFAEPARESAYALELVGISGELEQAAPVLAVLEGELNRLQAAMAELM